MSQSTPSDAGSHCPSRSFEVLATLKDGKGFKVAICCHAAGLTPYELGYLVGQTQRSLDQIWQQLIDQNRDAGDDYLAAYAHGLAIALVEPMDDSTTHMSSHMQRASKETTNDPQSQG